MPNKCVNLSKIPDSAKKSSFNNKNSRLWFEKGHAPCQIQRIDGKQNWLSKSDLKKKRIKKRCMLFFCYIDKLPSAFSTLSLNVLQRLADMTEEKNKIASDSERENSQLRHASSLYCWTRQHQRMDQSRSARPPDRKWGWGVIKWPQRVEISLSAS